MTEEEDLMIFGTVMYRLKVDGGMEHIPREKWDIFYEEKKDD